MIKIHNALILLMLLCCCATARAGVPVSFGSGANQFTIDFVTIGNPGNPPDTTARPIPAGAVGYVYNMGTYEVSRDMVTKANVEGNLGIALDSMNDVSGGPRADMPATGVSWNEAARFVNWLNTSQGFSPAYKFATQPGDVAYSSNENILLWAPGDAGYDASNLFRNSQARYFLPSFNEWHKAAYHKNDGVTGNYWYFPAGSDSIPFPVASGTDPGTVVFAQPYRRGPADITMAGGLSSYGTMAQGGNVWEWEESETDLVNDRVSSLRGIRGGTWDGDSDFLARRTSRSQANPVAPFTRFAGFRVASIPEPSAGLLGALGVLALLQRRRRSR